MNHNQIINSKYNLTYYGVSGHHAPCRYVLFIGSKKRRHLIMCARRVSGITFIRYAHNQKIGKLINLKLFVNKRTKVHKQGSQNH